MSEEIKTPSNPEDVKPEEKKSDESKSEYERLQELERNKSIALKQEREEKKALQDKLAEYEAKEKSEAEKEAKKKGQYEQLLAKKDEEIKILSEKAIAFDKFMEEKQKETTAKLDELKAKVGEDVLKDNMDILEDLSPEKQIKYLDKLLAVDTKKSFDPSTKKGNEKVDDFEILKQKVLDKKATPTERTNYLNILRQIKE